VAQDQPNLNTNRLAKPLRAERNW